MLSTKQHVVAQHTSIPACKDTDLSLEMPPTNMVTQLEALVVPSPLSKAPGIRHPAMRTLESYTQFQTAAGKSLALRPIIFSDNN